MKLHCLVAIFFVATAPQAKAQSGCPGEHFTGVHVVQATATAQTSWYVSAHHNGRIEFNQVNGPGYADGNATFSCRGDRFTMKFRQMSHGLNYDCTGRLENGYLYSDMICKNPDNGGGIIGSIRASDGKFE